MIAVSSRINIKKGLPVLIVLKEHQRTEFLTYGKVKDILTSKGTHTRGIKVRLEDGSVGRVQRILESAPKKLTHSDYEEEIIKNHLKSYNKIFHTELKNSGYNKNDIFIVDNFFMEVESLKLYTKLENHPFIDYLDEEQKRKIGNNHYIVLILNKIGRVNK